MRRALALCLLTMLFVLVAPAAAQKDKTDQLSGTGGQDAVQVTCPQGGEIINGVEVIVNMRPGFDYNAYVLGIGDFDPVIAVADENGVAFCNDDGENAAGIAANLPTSGNVRANNLNSFAVFNHNFDSFANISLIVGDIQGRPGEFVLLLEGMAVTRQDGAGDPFFVRITENMVNSGVPVTVYMISQVNELDPMINIVDNDNNVIVLSDGAAVQCDDAGTRSCFGDSTDLTGYSVGGLGGFQYDAMISIPLDGMELSPDEGTYFNYLMTSSAQRSIGDYVAAFHLGIGEAKRKMGA